MRSSPDSAPAPVGAPSFYAGIGSRRTPDDVLDLMERIAVRLRETGWTLRSGHAPGADQAFERGAGGYAELFLPWSGFESSVGPVGKVFTEAPDRAYELAAYFHPAWDRCSQGAKRLHARNCQQIYGPTCDGASRRSSFVVCWSNGTGGTEQALRIARAENIPITNLFSAETRQAIELWVGDSAEVR